MPHRNSTGVQAWNFVGLPGTASANMGDTNAPVTVDVDSWVTLLGGTFDAHVQAVQDNRRAWEHWDTSEQVWREWVHILNVGDRDSTPAGEQALSRVLKCLDLDDDPDGAGMFPRAPYGNHAYAVKEGLIAQGALRGIRRLRSPLKLEGERTLLSAVKQLLGAARHHSKPWFKYGDKQIRGISEEALDLLEALGWVTWFNEENGPSELHLTVSNSALAVATGPEGSAAAKDIAGIVMKQRSESRAAYLQLKPLDLDGKKKVIGELPEHVRTETKTPGTHLNWLFSGGYGTTYYRVVPGEDRKSAWVKEDSNSAERTLASASVTFVEVTASQRVASPDPEHIQGRKFLKEL